MDPFDPILDQPFSIDVDAIDPALAYRLANQDIYFSADVNTDLRDLYWPWVDTRYVASIRMQVSDPRDDDLMNLVTRFYPGYQEAILGSEGMIVSKRLAAPISSNYDRSVLWNLECQAEGDRLLRLDIEIDWGEPLNQRMVDGLLVAQQNPGQAQGIYAQQNADSTRVFGNPHGRPSESLLDDQAGHARLVYYVLVNGIVEVPLLLTISDVGEQVAWNGFLALRDGERVLEESIDQWRKTEETGRLWTPDPQLNRAVQWGRVAAQRRVQRLRTGLAPTSRNTAEASTLVDCLDLFDPIQSRNLLAHLRRLAEKCDGRLPERLPIKPRDIADPPSNAVLTATNTTYLTALHRHLRRYFDTELLAEHFAAVSACAEALIQLRWSQPQPLTSPAKNVAAAGLRCALELATLHGDGANAVRWESEVREFEREIDSHVAEPATGNDEVRPNLGADNIWRMHDDKPWDFTDDIAGMALSAEAVWAGCGLAWQAGELWVSPRQGNDWGWWALQNLPYSLQMDQPDRITLVWDGETLHSTLPVRSDVPLQIHSTIQVRGTDETSFDLHFEMNVPEESDAPPVLFRPNFDPRDA